MAALWKLPVIYVCENNLYNEYTHNSETLAGDIQLRGPAFGVESYKVDGQDVRAVYAITQKLVERGRNGEGPSILFCDTYRFHGHHVGDIAREYYRSKQEEQTWKTERDPVINMERVLTALGIVDAAALATIQTEIQSEMDVAVKFAIDAPYPAADKVDQDVYA
jgi:pyruvate dehydrogenase E1 component alpha subunit